MKALTMNTKLEFREIRIALRWFWANQFNTYLNAVFLGAAYKIGKNLWTMIELISMG